MSVLLLVLFIHLVSSYHPDFCSYRLDFFHNIFSESWLSSNPFGLIDIGLIPSNIGTVTSTHCTTGLEYSILPLPLPFAPLEVSWVSDGHIAPDPKYDKFSTRNASDDL